MKTADYRYGVDPVDGNDAWELMLACAAGDIEKVRRLIAKDHHLVNAQYSYQFPIHFAVREGHADIVRLLLENGAEPGRSRFMYDSWQNLVPEARRRGYDDVLTALESTLTARYGYDPEFEMLADAMRSRDRELVETLLAEKPSLAAASDVRGNNAIHWAVMTDMRDLIGPLTKLGADMEARRADGSTPILLAVNHDYWYHESRDVSPDIVDFLLERGADYPLSIALFRQDGQRIDELLRAAPALATQLNAARQSHLFCAARAGQTEVVRRLLDLGADPRMPEDLAPTGHALSAAAAGSHEAIVRLLLDHGADPESGADSSGSPYSMSLSRDPDGAAGRNIRELLLRHGAAAPTETLTGDVLRALLEADEDGSAAASYAKGVIVSNDPTLLRALLSKNPDVLKQRNIVARRFPTSPECIDLLFEHGLNANIADTFGTTWFHFIVERDYLEVAQRFVAEAVDINAVDPLSRETPLAIAARRSNLDMARFLLEAGANPNLPINRWARPAAYAVAADDTDMMALLRAYGADD